MKYAWIDEQRKDYALDEICSVLEQVVSWRGQPQAIRLDNGPEFLAEHFMSWCAERAIELRYIEPGKRDQNAFVERYDRTYRTEALNAYVFESLEQVRVSVAPLFIEWGSLWENGYVEAFNGKFRDELLNGELFYTLHESQVLIERWRGHYNTHRPHSALEYRPPAPETRTATRSVCRRD